MDRCFCYEKFKDQLPKGIKIECFKEKCRNYRENMKKMSQESREDSVK